MPQSHRLSPGSAVVGLVLAAAGLSGCGEDVLVARFGLTSNIPDGGLVEAASTVNDAGTDDNDQSKNAQRARANARAHENAVNHGNAPKPSDDDKH